MQLKDIENQVNRIDSYLYKQIGSLPRPLYQYVPGPLYWYKEVACYWYSVQITRRVRINFVPIVNQTRGLIIRTIPISRP